MQYSDVSGGLGIIQDVEYRTNIGAGNISSDTDLLKMFTVWANHAYSKAFHIMMEANKKWTVDDSNHTDRPVATTDLVSGQSQYTITSASPASNQDWLQVKRVEMETRDGVKVLLPATSLDQIGVSIDEAFKTDSQPWFYYFDGSSIILQVAPDYNANGGLKIWFARSPLYFAITDTTKRPGFDTSFHEYISLSMTYMWEKYKRVGDPEQTKRDIVEMEEAIRKRYSGRDRTVRKQLKRPSKIYK